MEFSLSSYLATSVALVELEQACRLELNAGLNAGATIHKPQAR